MKIFTRLAVACLLLAASLAPSFAAVIVVRVGNNWYRGPGVTTGDSDIRPINVGDQIQFVWVAGTHPTQSDSSPQTWPTFTPSASLTYTTPAYNTVGDFPYHCLAHGGVLSGQYGIIRVSMATTTPTLDARAAGIELSVYPNPSHGLVTVQLNSKAGVDYKLRLSNIIGQDVRTVALRPELTAAGLPLDLSDLRAGVYFYSLLVDGKVASTKRLVLQN